MSKPEVLSSSQLVEMSTALRARWGDVHTRSELDDLAEQVVAGESDPYTAADVLLQSFTD